MGSWVVGIGLCALAACGRWGYDPLAGDGGLIADASDVDARDCTSGCTEVTVSSGLDDDDGAINRGQLHISGVTGGLIELGHLAGDPAWGYFRFRLPTAIPSGASIVDTRLTLQPDPADGWDEARHQLRIFAEDTADAAVITSFEERPDGTVPGFVRAVLDTPVGWNDAGLPWPADGPISTPSLAPLLQRLVDDRGGLAVGSHVQFWIRGEGFSVDAAVVVADGSRPSTPQTSFTFVFVRP